jgi:hypothetical protein
VKIRSRHLPLVAVLPLLGGAALAQPAAAQLPLAQPSRAPLEAGPAPAAAPRAWSDDERAAITLLRSLRKKERPSDQELAARLSRGGERVLPLFLEILVTREVPALEPGETKQGEPQVLSEVQELALLLAVAQLEREPVLGQVGAVLQSGGGVRQRYAAIGCLGVVGRANDLLQLFDLAFTQEETALDERLARALRRAVTALVSHDPRAFEQLVALRRITRPELLPVLVASVGAAKDPRGLAYLSEVAYWHEDLIVEVMSHVPLLGPCGDEVVDAAVKVRMRPYLDETRPGPCRAAIVALTAMGDDDSIGALIGLLTSESAGLRENAHWGLKQLTGLGLSSAPEVWTRWHQGELYWLVREKPRAFQLLRERNPATATDALREILLHPLARHELAAALPDLLKSPWPALRMLACRTLEDLEAKTAIGRLVWALEDPEPDVAQAAHAALRTLTKLDLPREPLAWQSATNTQPRGAEL